MEGSAKESLMPRQAHGHRSPMIPDNWNCYQQDGTGKYMVVASTDGPGVTRSSWRFKNFGGSCGFCALTFQVAAFVMFCILADQYNDMFLLGAFSVAVVALFAFLLPEEQERRGVWIFFIMMYALFAGWYGWEAECKGHHMHWNKCKKQWSRLDLYTLLARATAKLISMACTFLILIAVRSVSSALNYLPPSNRGWLNWRTFHMLWASFMVVCSAVHSLGHLLRLFQSHDPLWSIWYEWWELGSGVGLWVLIGVLGLPYYYTRIVHFLTDGCGKGDDEDSADSSCPQFMKDFFRWTHRIAAVIFAFVFYFHSYASGPSIMLFFWYMDYRAHQISYPSENGPIPTEFLPTKHDTEDDLDKKWQGFLNWKAAFSNGSPIKLQFDKCEGRPHEFGVYYQVEVADNAKQWLHWPLGIAASFTGASDKLTTNVDGVVVSRLTFQIDTKTKPAFIVRLGQKVAEFPVKSIHDLRDLNRSLNIKIYGPYHSIDYTFRSARSVVSLTSGIGNTVWENLSSMHESDARQWRPLIGIKFRSMRSAPSGALSPSEQKSLQSFEDFLRGAYEKPRDELVPPYSVDLFCDIKGDLSGATAHELISFILWVERDVLRLRKERINSKAALKDDDLHDNPETQFIACGNLANKVVRRAVNRAGKKGDTWKKLIHEEDFQVETGDMISLKSIFQNLAYGLFGSPRQHASGEDQL